MNESGQIKLECQGSAERIKINKLQHVFFFVSLMSLTIIHVPFNGYGERERVWLRL